jgi:signal transduction histidine kinase
MPIGRPCDLAPIVTRPAIVAMTMVGTATGTAFAAMTSRSLVKRTNNVESVVQHERMRLAREFHDSVARELAFIIGQSRRLALAFPNERALAHIASAAVRALDGSRRTIYGLQHTTTHTLGGAIEHSARVLASRAGLDLDIEVTDDIVPSTEVEHCLLSILQEGISNAVRHAHATRLTVSMRSQEEDMVELRISDDGRGFDPDSAELSEAMVSVCSACNNAPRSSAAG